MSCPAPNPLHCPCHNPGTTPIPQCHAPVLTSRLCSVYISSSFPVSVPSALCDCPAWPCCVPDLYLSSGLIHMTFLFPCPTFSSHETVPDQHLLWPPPTPAYGPGPHFSSCMVTECWPEQCRRYDFLQLCDNN